MRRAVFISKVYLAAGHLTHGDEESDGTLRLLSHFGEVLAELPPRLQLVMSGQDLPWAA